MLRGPLFGLSDPRAVRVQAVRRLVLIFTQAGDVGCSGAPASEESGAPQWPAAEPAPADRVRRRRSTRCASTTAGRACSRPAPRSTGSSSTPATSRSPRPRPAASKRATSCTPSTASARSLEDGGSLADAADALEADSEASNEVESLPLEPGRTDVVRLMNLHKAKGLEADVVFLADPCGGFKPRVDVHIERDGDQALGLVPGRRRGRKARSPSTCSASTPTGPQHEEAEQPFLDAEQNRLLYVAATRAREMLVVSRWTGKQGAAPRGVRSTASSRAAKELPVPATVRSAARAPASDCSANGAGGGATPRASPRTTVSSSRPGRSHP